MDRGYADMIHEMNWDWDVVEPTPYKSGTTIPFEPGRSADEGIVTEPGESLLEEENSKFMDGHKNENNPHLIVDNTARSKITLGTILVSIVIAFEAYRYLS